LRELGASSSIRDIIRFGYQFDSVSSWTSLTC
jgi:hypothetical protein